MANGRFGFVRPTSESRALEGIPQELLGLGRGFISEGLIPQQELGGLISSSAREAAFRRRGLARGLRRRQGRRLGSRSSTIDQLVANRVFAPSFAGFEAGTRDLFARNRFGGRTAGVGALQGSFNQFFSNRARRDALRLAEQRRQDELDAQSGGLGGIIGAGLPLVGDIASIAFGGPAGAASVAGRRLGSNSSDYIGLGSPGSRSSSYRNL